MGQVSTSETPTLNGIKVLDRSVLIPKSVVETPHTLVELCEDTDLPHATVHRPTTALEVHRFVIRIPDRRWTTGPGFIEITPVTINLLVDAVAHILPKLVEATGESVQLYHLTGDARTYIASMEPTIELCSTVLVGSCMPPAVDSAARAPLVFGPASLTERMLSDADFNQQDLDDYQRLGWSESVGERDPVLVSISAPVFDGNQRMIAVLSVSGPVERTTPPPYERWGVKVLAAVEEMSSRL